MVDLAAVTVETYSDWAMCVATDVTGTTTTRITQTTVTTLGDQSDTDDDDNEPLPGIYTDDDVDDDDHDDQVPWDLAVVAELQVQEMQLEEEVAEIVERAEEFRWSEFSRMMIAYDAIMLLMMDVDSDEELA